VRRAIALAALAAAVGACAGHGPTPRATPAVASAGPLPPRTPSATPAPSPDPHFPTVDAAVEKALAEGKLPGCVVVIGRKGAILHRRAYGSRSLVPERMPMTMDTVFDLASMTKAIATATSLMILVERGTLDLGAPASRYLPELAALPPFTVEQLLLHTSGLAPVTPLSDYEAGPEEAVRRIAARKVLAAPGERFAYSDVGYVLLGEIVRRVSGDDLATFARRAIFEPIGMKETGFLPGPELARRAAPTEPVGGEFQPGIVHDPRARALGGVAGHAGLFSTADDLVRFAQAVLRRGKLDGKRVVHEKTLALFLARRETSKGGRALGWDIDSVYATSKAGAGDGEAPKLSPHAVGHGGFTGTALWIDPEKDLFVLFLSNRVHPDGRGVVNPLVAEIGALALRATEVQTGLDVLRATHFEALRGARVGLVTNDGARTRDGRTAADVFARSKEVRLAALFAPEHGLGVDKEGAIADGVRGGIPVYGLYGERFAPPPEALRDLDALVVDLQDVGVRFYTYASTMRHAMKVADAARLRFVVLDRPNPLGGTRVEGPVYDGRLTFVGSSRLPLRHGMTMGELARLFAREDRTFGGGAERLEIVRMESWRRDTYWDETGLTWTPPSPNLRTPAAAMLYPALGVLEGANVSVGRGTSAPFELLGAPWIDADALVAALERAKLSGIVFAKTTFVPSAAPFRGQLCRGISVRVVDRESFDPARTGVALALALRETKPLDFQLDRIGPALGSAPALEALRAGQPADAIVRLWEPELEEFRKARASVLLYP
jgi:uncharacterized protein YbbC (DUF1343 family)